MIDTERLILRPWHDGDRVPFAAMGQDPEVMAHLGPLRTRAQSDAGVDGLIAEQQQRGHCFWAMERRADGAFLGFCGIDAIDSRISGIAGEAEIGWRLRRDAWGLGYAREAAQASLDWGFANLPSDRIIAITTPGNVRSWGLMERLGMIRRHDLDFDHPALLPGDPLRPHITYEKRRA